MQEKRIGTLQNKNSLKGYKNGIVETKEKSIQGWTDKVRKYISLEKDIDNQLYQKHNRKIENKSLLNTYALNKNFTQQNKL